MTAPVTPSPIIAFSGTLPDPSDPTTYGTRGRSVWSWEVGDLFNGMNALGTATYTNAVAAAESAEIATMTAGALLWDAATNYTTGQSAISPIDMQTYRRKSPGGVDATDPSVSALWTRVGLLIVGPVSQVSGIPTGAIMEHSTTGSAHAVKLADGTAIEYVYYAQSGSSGLTTPGSVPFSYSYITEFISSPSVSVNYVGGSSANWRAEAEANGISGVAGFVHNTSGGSLGLSFSLQAIGRWY